MSTAAQDFNAQVIDEFRSNGGEVGGPFAGAPMLLLHHTGAKSGEARVAPLVYLADGGRYVIFGSKAGAPTHPAWYHNLTASPQTTIEVGTETVAVAASEAAGDERERLFRAQADRMPTFDEYVRKAAPRLIPVIVLTPGEDRG